MQRGNAVGIFGTLPVDSFEEFYDPFYYFTVSEFALIYFIVFIL